MSVQRGADTKGSEHLLAHIGDAGTHCVLKAPHPTSALVSSRVIDDGDTSTGGIERIIHRSAERSDLVRNAVAVCINKVCDPILFLAVVGHSTPALGRPLLVHLQTVFDRLKLQIILKREL